MERIEDVKLGDLNTGDQIAVIGTNKLLLWLVSFFTNRKCQEYFHHGIFDKENEELIELQGGTKWTSIPKRRPMRQFLGDGKPYRIVYRPENCLPVEETMKLAKKVLEKQSCWPNYHAFKFNCETFATYLKTGIRTSAQVSKFSKLFIHQFVVSWAPRALLASTLIPGAGIWAICGMKTALVAVLASSAVGGVAAIFSTLLWAGIVGSQSEDAMAGVRAGLKDVAADFQVLKDDNELVLYDN